MRQEEERGGSATPGCPAACVIRAPGLSGREPALMGGVECWRAGMLRLQRQAGWTVSTNEEGEPVVGLGLPAGGAR